MYRVCFFFCGKWCSTDFGWPEAALTWIARIHGFEVRGCDLYRLEAGDFSAKGLLFTDGGPSRMSGLEVHDDA